MAAGTWCLVALGPLVLAASPGAPETAAPSRGPEPVRVDLQVGGVSRLELEVVIEGISVADPKVVSVRQAGDRGVQLRALGVGRSLVMLWTVLGRQLVVVRVTAPPRASETARPARAAYWGLERKPDQTLYVYRGSASVARSEGERTRFSGQRHGLSTVVPAASGTVTGDVSLDAPHRAPARIDWLHLGYERPLFSLEAGDLTTHTLSRLDPYAPARGALAAYHDSKYRLALFGGTLRTGMSEGLYDLSGPSQFGAQSQFIAADNLRLSVQAIRTGASYARRPGPTTTVSSAAQWQPLSSLMLDGENAFNDVGASARVAAAYDAPLLTAHALYQVMGEDFLYARAPRSDMGQLSLSITPSPYYRATAAAGGSSLGAPLFDERALAESAFVYSALDVTLGGTANDLLLELRYLADRDTQSPIGAQRYQRSGDTAEVIVQSALPRAVGFFRVGALADRTRASIPTRQERRSLGGRGELWLQLETLRLALNTRIDYQRRTLVASASAVPSDFVAVSQSAIIQDGALGAQLHAFLTHETSAIDASDSLGGRLVLAYRPNAAHEVRADVGMFQRWGPLPLEMRSFGLRQPWLVTGLVSYIHYFGSAVDAPVLFGLLERSSVRVAVFVDANENGQRDAGEHGVAAVGVWLDDVEHLETEPDGAARFAGVRPGHHELRIDVEAMPGMKFTSASTRSLWITKGETKEIEIGLSDRAAIFGTVFNDANLDGQYQPGEPGISVIEVALSTHQGVIEHAVSAAGSFVFRGLAPGGYAVDLNPRSFQQGYVWKNGDGKGNGHKAAHVELQPGSVAVVKFALQALRAVKGRVFFDRDGNGVLGPADEPVSGVLVRLDGQQVTTDADGRYLFRDLPAGRLAVSIEPATLPVGRAPLSPTRIELELSAEPTSETVDFATRAKVPRSPGSR